MIKRILPFLLLALVTVACQEGGPTVPTEGPRFARGGKPGPPDDKPDKGATAEVELCAKKSVVDAINNITERSTGPDERLSAPREGSWLSVRCADGRKRQSRQ